MRGAAEAEGALGEGVHDTSPKSHAVHGEHEPLEETPFAKAHEAVILCLPCVAAFRARTTVNRHVQGSGVQVLDGDSANETPANEHDTLARSLNDTLPMNTIHWPKNEEFELDTLAREREEDLWQVSRAGLVCVIHFSLCVSTESLHISYF